MKHGPDDIDSDWEHAQKARKLQATSLGSAEAHSLTKLGKLNERYVRDLNTACRNALDFNNEVDLKPFFEEYTRRYSRMRDVLQSKQSQTSQDHSREQAHSLTTNISSLSRSIPVVKHALDPQVKAFLESETARDSIELSRELLNTQKLLAVLTHGKTLYAAGERTLTQIHPNIVVKSGQELDLSEMDVLYHIHKVSKEFPAPRPLGSLILDGKAYLFMTFIEGSTLETLWPSMSADAKSSACDQISIILSKLRSLPLGSAQFGSGTPARCKDVRRFTRYSTSLIHNEDEFNNFLLSTAKSGIAQSYKEHVRSKCLQSHHSTVLTHGDLHPRNILAELHGSTIKINGIVDWEAGGSYPEYWEYIKSLNTVSSVEEEDWLRYLPVRGMGEYPNEWAVDMLLESIIE